MAIIGGMNIHMLFTDVGGGLKNFTSAQLTEAGLPTMGDGNSFPEDSNMWKNKGNTVWDTTDRLYNAYQDIYESFIGDGTKYDFYAYRQSNNALVFSVTDGSGFTSSNWEDILAANQSMYIVAHLRGSETWYNEEQVVNDKAVPSWDSGCWYFIWDEANDDLLVTYDCGSTSYVIADGTILDMEDLEEFLETIFPTGSFEFAYNETTGAVTIHWTGYSETTTVSHSVELQETLNLGDEASAFIVSRYPVDGSEWI